MIRFSVVIPTCNRPEPLGACLAALGQLDFPREAFEVIVVDDGSDRPVEEVVTRVGSPLNVSVLTRANGGPASARNAAAERARGHYLAFTDDDCLPATDWLTRLDARFQQNPHHMVGGRTINGATASPCASLSQLVVDAAYEHYNIDPRHAVFFAANNMAMAAARFRKSEQSKQTRQTA